MHYDMGAIRSTDPSFAAAKEAARAAALKSQVAARAALVASRQVSAPKMQAAAAPPEAAAPEAPASAGMPKWVWLVAAAGIGYWWMRRKK